LLWEQWAAAAWALGGLGIAVGPQVASTRMDGDLGQSAVSSTQVQVEPNIRVRTTAALYGMQINPSQVLVAISSRRRFQPTVRPKPDEVLRPDATSTAAFAEPAAAWLDGRTGPSRRNGWPARAMQRDPYPAPGVSALGSDAGAWGRPVGDDGSGADSDGSRPRLGPVLPSRARAVG